MTRVHFGPAHPVHALAALALFASAACGGTAGAPGTGGATADAGGTPNDSGGAPSASGGTPSSSGGAPSGGSPSSGGAPSSGGTSSGTGGTNSTTTGWDEVRCWRLEAATARLCYARLGNLWAPVAPLCEFDGEPKNPMTESVTSCGSADDPAGWDETWCDDSQCYGRLSGWATVLQASCTIPEGVEPAPGTPAELLCDAAPEAPTGWDGVACYTQGGGTQPFCFGFRGLYYPSWGLYPTCDLETGVAIDPDYVELEPDEVVCE